MSLYLATLISDHKQRCHESIPHMMCPICVPKSFPSEEDFLPVHHFAAKPVTVSGIEWDGSNFEEIKRFCNGLANAKVASTGELVLTIETREGSSRATVGDWILRGTTGEFYPVKPDVMEAKYNQID